MLFSKVFSRLHVGLVPVNEILLFLPLRSLSIFLFSLDSVLFFLVNPHLFLFMVSLLLSFFFSLYSTPLSLRLSLLHLSILGLNL